MHWFNAGNHPARGAAIFGAPGSPTRAPPREFPAFAEAQASLGAVRQLAGRARRRRGGVSRTRRAPAPIFPVSTENLALVEARAAASEHP